MMRTRGELAKHCDVNPETIRFYERSGLLPATKRTASGYRQYDDTAVQRLQFIKRSQAVGFSLDEIRALLDLQFHADEATCGDVRAMVDVKLAEIDQQIAHLHSMKQVLQQFRRECPGGDESAASCPILASFLEVQDQNEFEVHEIDQPLHFG
ncbi:MAG: Zn(2+)-responsive transcriptional regulator [Chloroflexi bacterium]|nr:Zn(2+)-responsive transcriptional regulator [Chloroflexota bacterium]